jgi:hypothetical protein
MHNTGYADAQRGSNLRASQKQTCKELAPRVGAHQPNARFSNGSEFFDN